MATVSEYRTTTYIAYVSHGALRFQETRKRAPRVHARLLDKDAYAFFYFDIITCVVDGVALKSERVNVSKEYFVDAEVFGLRRMARDGYDGPLSYMKEHKLKSMVRNRYGNFVTKGFDRSKHSFINITR